MNKGPSRDIGAAGRPGIGIAESICLGALITLGYVAIPSWLLRFAWSFLPDGIQISTINYWSTWAFSVLQLGIGLLLVLSAPVRSGICIGSIRWHWKKVLLVCGVPVALASIIYPFLPFRPFSDQPVTVWLISPVAQDLVFIGYLYGRFEPVAFSYLHRRVPIRWALVLTAGFFSLHHISGYACWPAAFVTFQMLYTFLGLLLIGLSRQWTGSIAYAAATHIAVNLIAWAIP